MIRIDGRPPAQGISGAQPQRANASGQGFALPTLDRATQGESARRVATTQSAVPLDTLIAVQANEDAGERRRRQTRRGNDLLDGLDRLKAALLAGRVPIVDLERLKAMLAARREATDDPRLDEILAHIELRAAVELAKLGR